MMLVKRTYKRNRNFRKQNKKLEDKRNRNFRKQIKKLEDNIHDQEESTNDFIELPVPDVIDYNLNVLFVGLFSGKKSIKERHHYSSSKNHFYYALYESGMTNGDNLTYLDDQRLARDYKIGIVTLVSRPVHRSKTKLSVEEIMQGFPTLLKKVEKYRPKVLCFNGRAAFQAFAIFQNSRIHSSWKEMATKDWGEQPNYSIPWNDHTGCTKVSCVVSTSGRVAQYNKQYKAKQFEKLKKLIDNDEGDEEIIDVKIKEKDIDLINAYANEEFNNEQDDCDSSYNKREDNCQDYSPPKSFMAKRW